MCFAQATSSKFSIRRDSESKLYYTLSNNVTETNLAVNTPECLTARNNLVFAVSEDLINCTSSQPFAVRGMGLN